MIQINLLDQGSPRRRGSSAPPPVPGASRSSGGNGAAVIALVAVMMLALNGYVGWQVYRTWNASYQKYQTALIARDKAKAEIGKKMKEADRIREYREVINNQMDVLRTLDPPNRLLWSEKFNMLANLVPPNVCLAAIDVDENVVMTETKASIAAREKWEKGDVKTRGAAPEKVMRPVIHYVLRITGLGLGRDNVEQFNNALKFHEAIITYSEVDDKGVTHKFMDGFNSNIDFESVEATMYEGEPVNKFIFRLTTTPVPDARNEPDTGDKAPAPKKTQVAAATAAR